MKGIPSPSLVKLQPHSILISSGNTRVCKRLHLGTSALDEKNLSACIVEGHDPLLEYVIEILSLKKIEHKVTRELISGVDRQKLTTAKLSLGTYSAMLYDQPLLRSDLATTYDLVDTIRTISRIQQSSTIMSLTQLSEEVFDLFDRVILLSDGHVYYKALVRMPFLTLPTLGT